MVMNICEALDTGPYQVEHRRLLHELFTVVLDGRNKQVMHGLEDALGRPPARFRRLCPQYRRYRRLERLIMIQAIVTIVLWCSAIGCGLLAGLYFAFSTFIMTALGRIEQVHGVTAMNSINATILQSLFMPFFLGTTLVSLVLAVVALFRWGESGSTAMLAAGIAYVWACSCARCSTTCPSTTPLPRSIRPAPPPHRSGRAI